MSNPHALLRNLKKRQKQEAKTLDQVSKAELKAALKGVVHECLDDAWFNQVQAKKGSAGKRASLVSKVSKASENTFTFIASKEIIDRDGDLISLSGMDLAQFKTNPVILFAHDIRQPPVARATAISIKGDELLVDIEFPEEGISAKADEVRGLVEAGFLNAVSIGFQPRETSLNAETGGLNFLKTELHEISLVPVPANQAALRVRGLESMSTAQLKTAIQSLVRASI